MFAIDKEKVYWKKVEGETVILNIDSGFYYTLDEVGSAVWERVLLNQAPEAIISAITEEFEVDEATARKDIAVFLKSMEKEELIKATERG